MKDSLRTFSRKVKWKQNNSRQLEGMKYFVHDSSKRTKLDEVSLCPERKSGGTLSLIFAFGKGGWKGGCDGLGETDSGENIDPHLTSLNRRAFSGLSSIARSLFTRASTSESSWYCKYNTGYNVKSVLHLFIFAHYLMHNKSFFQANRSISKLHMQQA